MLISVQVELKLALSIGTELGDRFIDQIIAVWTDIIDGFTGLVITPDTQEIGSKISTKPKVSEI